MIAATYDLDRMAMVRSDLGDGGWSIHVRRTDVDDEDDNDAQVAWPIVASGPADSDADGEWTRPDDTDWGAARAAALALAKSSR